MDRATARSLVALGAEDKDQTQFTPEQYNTAIELAEQQFAIDGKALIKEETLTIVAGATAEATEIALPTKWLFGVVVLHKGLRLRPVNRFDLSFQNGADWRTVTGTPVCFYIDEEEEKIGFYPVPQAADAGAFLDVLYAAAPDAISSDGTALLNAKALLQYYVPAVIAWATWKVLSWKVTTNEIVLKRRECILEYQHYTAQAIEVYKNMGDQPIQMKGGRDWQDRIMRAKPNAFDV